MEYAVVTERSHLDICLNLFDLEVCRSIHFTVTHKFVTVCLRTQWKSNVNSHMFTKKRDVIKHICEDGIPLLSTKLQLTNSEDRQW